MTDTHLAIIITVVTFAAAFVVMYFEYPTKRN